MDLRRKLTVFLQANTRDLNKGLKDAGKSLDGFNKKLGKFGRKTSEVGDKMTRSVTLPVIGAGAAIFKASNDFDTAMSQIVGLVGVASDQVEEWKDDLLRLGPELGKTPQELAEALFFVTSAGFRGSEAIDVLTASAKASVGGLGETASIADAVTSAINAYGAESISASEATDTLVAAVREGKLEAASLTPVMGRLLPVAANLGVEFDEVSGFMATMSRTGADASSAASGLRGIMAKLQKPTAQANDILKEYGLSAEGLRKQVKDEGLLSVLRTLDETFGDNEEAMGKVFEDVEALTAVYNVLGQDAEVVDGIMQGVSKATGATQKAFESVDPEAQQWRQSLAEVNATLIELGNDIGPMIADVIKTIAEQVRGAMEWWNGLSEGQQKTIIKMVGFLAVAGPVLSIVGRLITAVSGAASAFKWLTVGKEGGKGIVGATRKLGGFSKKIPGVNKVIGSMTTQLTGAGGLAAGFGIVAGAAVVAYAAIQKGAKETERVLDNTNKAVEAGYNSDMNAIKRAQELKREGKHKEADAILNSFRNRAFGGPVTANQPYVVGEVGPELFVPRNAGTVIPNNQLRRNNGGSLSSPTGGMNVTFAPTFKIGMFAGMPNEKRKIAEDMWREFTRIAKSNGVTLPGIGTVTQ